MGSGAPHAAIGNGFGQKITTQGVPVISLGGGAVNIYCYVCSLSGYGGTSDDGGEDSGVDYLFHLYSP
jgi:hypothetical protein